MTTQESIVRKSDTVRGWLTSPTMKQQLQMVLPKHLPVDRLVRTAMTALRTNPTLLDCTKDSLLAAVMGCAQLGLEPEPFLGQAYLIPFKNKGQLEVVLIPGYRGYLSLARRSGEVQSVMAQVVYTNDHFILQYGTQERLEHIPAEGTRGEPRGAYVVFRYKDGSYSFDYMTEEDIEKIRARSKAKDDGPWVTDWAEMAKKTVIRRHVKIAPLAVEIQKAAVLEDRYYAGEPQRDVIFPDGGDGGGSGEGVEPTIEDFDKLVEDKKLTKAKLALLEKYVEAVAEHIGLTLAECKQRAAEKWDEFWTAFESWAESQEKEKPKRGRPPKKDEQEAEEQTEDELEPGGQEAPDQEPPQGADDQYSMFLR